MRGPLANEISFDFPAFRFRRTSTAPRGDPDKVCFRMACSVVVTISQAQWVCEDWLDRVAGATLADCIDRGDQFLDRVSLIHLTPLRFS